MQKYKFNKNILSDFSWTNLSWLGWMLSIGEFCNTTLNLEKLLEKSIKEEWNPKKIKHRKFKVIIQKIYCILAWFKTNNTDQYIKNDPIFKELLWEVIPKTTVNRVLNTFWEKVEKWLQDVILEIEKFNISTNKKTEVIVDIDTTYDPASENIEKSTYNTHYWTTGYSPILAFDWLTWDLIIWELRPWNFACSKEALEFIKKIINFYEENNVKMSFRLDSWFATPEIYEYLESKWIKYYIKMKRNSVLVRKMDDYVNKTELIPWKSTFSEFKYSAESWNKDRRIIACIDWINQETKESKSNKNKDKEKQYSLIPFYSFIVTNDENYLEKEVFSMYNWRATIETLIEEWKNWFFMDKLSHKTFETNSAVFQIHMLTISIFQLFRKMTTGEKKEWDKEYKDNDYDWKFEWIEKKWRKIFSLKTIDTFRLELFRIPTRVVKMWRKLLFRFESTFWWKELYKNIMAKINSFPRLEVNF